MNLRAPQFNTVVLSFLFAVAFFALINHSHAEPQIKCDEQKGKVNYKRSLVFDKNGVPSFDYGTVNGSRIGYQRNPITISFEAMKFYDDFLLTHNSTAKLFFLNNANWLKENSVSKVDRSQNISFSTYDYSFPWPAYNLVPPWTSAMANGLALNVLAKAYSLTTDNKYLDSAKYLLRSFFIDVNNGGVAYIAPKGGWWYEEYATKAPGAVHPKVLNGFMYALLALNNYSKTTNDLRGQYLFDQGILSLKNALPNFDYNGRTYYDALGNLANHDYEKVHIDLLRKLFDLTHEQEFGYYSERWNLIRNLSCGYNVDERKLKLLEDLLQPAFKWQGLFNEKINSSGAGLDLQVNSSNSKRTFHGVATKTSFDPKIASPLVLSFETSVKGKENFIGFAIEFRNADTKEVLWGVTINETGLSRKQYILPNSLTGVPSDLRLYMITSAPGNYKSIVSKLRFYTLPTYDEYLLFHSEKT